VTGSIEKTLKRDLHFLISAQLAYLAGAVLSRFSTRAFDLLGFLVGLLIFWIGYGIKNLLAYLTSNKINPYSKINFNRGNLKARLFLITILLFFGLFTAVYLVFKRQMLIGVNFIYISFILFAFLLPLSRFGKILLYGYDVLFEALIVSPFMFMLGSGLQGRNPGSTDVLIALPLFFCFFASAIAFRFPDFQTDQENSLPKTILTQIGWEKSLKLHNYSVLAMIISLALYLLKTRNFIFFPALLSVPLISGFEIYLLRRLAIGMKPNWRLLRLTAVLLIFSLVYAITIKYL
jgi:hypothetical protein